MRRRGGRCKYGTLSLLGCLLAVAIPEMALAQSCNITAEPPGPVKPGAWVEFSSGCTGSPIATEWGSSLGICAPTSGPVTVCTFPVEGEASVVVGGYYAGSLGPAFDTYDISVRNLAPLTCLVTASPRGPVLPGAWADLQAHCTGNPSSIQWSGSFSGLATCEPIIGSSTTCNFPNLGTTQVRAQANYPGCFAADTYPMVVSESAAPNCSIDMSPRGPLQPGAWADVFARCSGSPASIQWASSLASCSPLTGAATVCNFPTPGIATLDVAAAYAGSLHASDRMLVSVTSGAAPTCSIRADPPSPVRAGDSATLSAGCTPSVSSITWQSCLANCSSSTGATIDCVFPLVGNANFTVNTLASYPGHFGIGPSDTFVMRVNVPLSACTYSLSPSDLSGIPSAGGRYTVTLGDQEGCPVGGTSFQPWVKVSGLAPGTSSTAVTLDVDPNPGPPRATSIVLAGRLYLITQLGGP